MPKRTPSEPEVETVGGDTWDALWRASMPQQYPLESELKPNGWRTIQDLQKLWDVCGNLARKRSKLMVEAGQLETTMARVGWSKFPARMYRPIPPVKKSAKR